MSRCPFATWRPLPETNTEPLIRVRAVVFHTAVSSASSLYPFFNSPGVDVESHFYNQKGGGVEQYVDTAHQADAQFDGNAYAVSVESWDGAQAGVPYVAIPWTPAQLESNARLAAWAHQVHGVELVKAYKHSDGTIHGVGYHAQFTQEWNRHYHACPGAPRIAQMPQLIARANELATGVDDMTPDELMDFDTIPSPMLGPDNPTATVRGGLALIMQWALAGRDSARAAARDSAAALAIVKASAASGAVPLTAAQIEAAAAKGAQAAIDAEITGATVSLNVTPPAP